MYLHVLVLPVVAFYDPRAAKNVELSLNSKYLVKFAPISTHIQYNSILSRITHINLSKLTKKFE